MEALRQSNRRSVRWGWLGAVLLLGVTWGSPLFAQASSAEEQSSSEEATSAERGREIVLEKYDLRCRRPEAWVRGQPGKGAVLTLRAAGDPNAQIEVRVSSPITREKREDFFNSFHSKLKSAGFIEVDRRPAKSHGGLTGREVEYEGSTSEGEFRLIVWQYYRGGEAWLVSGFFRVPRRDGYYPDFAELIESFEFSEE